MSRLHTAFSQVIDGPTATLDPLGSTSTTGVEPPQADVRPSRRLGHGSQTRMSTAAAMIAVLALLFISAPVTAVAARLITGADIRDGSVGTDDIKDGSLRRRDFVPGTLPTLHRWTFHVAGSSWDGHAQVASADTVPEGSRVSIRDVQVAGDLSACDQEFLIDIRMPTGDAGGSFSLGRFNRNHGDARELRDLSDGRVVDSPQRLYAYFSCRGPGGGPLPVPAHDVTVLFETTAPAPGPALRFG